MPRAPRLHGIGRAPACRRTPACFLRLDFGILHLMNRGTGSLALALLPLLILAVSACGGGSDDLAFGLKSDVVASGDRPYVMAFAPDGRLFYGEQYSGAIRVVGADGIAQADPFAQLQVQTYIDLDWGLTGIALDPDFQTNHYVYAFYTEPVDPSMPTGRPKLVRFTDQNGRGDAETVISDNFPVTSPQHQGYNANGRLHFGPDGFLYLSIGDYDTPDPVQDLSEPIGKLLRVKKEDGSAAPGNPYLENPAADPRIFAIGFREPFDLALQLRGAEHHYRRGQLRLAQRRRVPLRRLLRRRRRPGHLPLRPRGQATRRLPVVRGSVRPRLRPGRQVPRPGPVPDGLRVSALHRR